jgi:hypothetical protein
VDQRELLETYTTAVGEQLTFYVLNITSDDLPAYRDGAKPFDQQQAQSAEVLWQISNLVLPYDQPSTDQTTVIRAVLGRTDDQGIPVARHLHLQSGGADPDIESTGPIEESLVRLALDSYPTFLLPPDEQIPRIPFGLELGVVRQLFTHPSTKTFEEAVLREGTLSKSFVDEGSGAGRAAWLWRNTGSGSTLQLTMLPQFLLGTAWRHVRHEDPTPDAFLSDAISLLQLVLDGLRGDTVDIPARYAFAGVLLPDGVTEVQLTDAVLETATPQDRELAPEPLRQQLTGTDSSGITTVINYDGDIVMSRKYPMKMRLEPPPKPQEVPMWPDEMRVPDSIERSIDRLRISLTLAVDRPQRIQLVPTWRFYDDPLGYGLVQSWSDPRTAVELVPTGLTEQEVAEWVSWYALLSNPGLDKINLAITRVLKASAERRDPPDVLVDSVIAWENIFGAREGEPTLRVTASLAILLEPDPALREQLRSRLGKIYGLRSDVVHGNRALDPDDFPMCQEALDVAIRAIRVIAKDRSDLLSLRDGAARSTRLLLGG